jgi:hypothetical protein
LEKRAQADRDGWHLVQNFKLHLHPEALRSNSPFELPKLPPKTTIDQILADWFRYILNCTRQFFCNRESEGEKYWNQLESTIEYAIVHPNAWEHPQQYRLRQAMVAAGLVPRAQAQTRVRFVTEAEASVHFIMVDGNFKARLEPKTEFIVCNAGGSTVDIASYIVQSTNPTVNLREQRTSCSIQAGSILVNETANQFLKEQLSTVSSGETLEAFLEEALDDFDAEAKRTFCNHGQSSIKVGRRNLNYPSINLHAGNMILNNSQMERFLSPGSQTLFRVSSNKSIDLQFSALCLLEDSQIRHTSAIGLQRLSKMSL